MSEDPGKVHDAILAIVLSVPVFAAIFLLPTLLVYAVACLCGLR
jgi:hypothetical protein